LYVAGLLSNTIAIYDLATFGTPQIGTISQGVSGPYGIAIDGQGTLYVANENTGNVTIYPAGTSAPSLTLSQGLTDPFGVAVDTNGDVYVTNPAPGAPDIVVYPQGQIAPSRTIKSSSLRAPNQLVFDSARNLYICDSFTGVWEIPFSSQQLTSLNLRGLVRPIAITIDPLDGDLFVSLFSGAGEVLVFAPGNVNAVRSLNNSEGADTLTVGKVGRVEEVFVPDSKSSIVHVFKHNQNNPKSTINTPGAHYPFGVAFKPAGVP
jgi:serine/threonine-protein kinase